MQQSLEYPDRTPITRLETILPLLEEQRQAYERQRKVINELHNIETISSAETRNIKNAITLLETYYAREKEKVTRKLEKDLTEIINLWYENDYDFMIYSQTQRGKVYTTLIDKKRKGRLNLICGGAVKQTLGVLFNFAFIRSVGSEFIFLDESFSSLGMEEIHRLPDVFDMINDLQLICIEHKVELIDSSTAATIKITRETGESTKFTIDDPNLVLKSSIQQLDDISETQQDLKVLKDFGFDVDKVRQARRAKGFYDRADYHRWNDGTYSEYLDNA